MTRWAHIADGAVAALAVSGTSPGSGWTACNDTVSVGWTHDGAEFAEPRLTEISPGALLDRFTPAEQIAVASLVAHDPAVQLGLTIGLARGVIDLAGATFAQWLARIVAAGAVTADRATIIATP